jgi:hypothetical protein
MRMLDTLGQGRSKRSYIVTAKGYAMFCINCVPAMDPRAVESAVAWMYAMREGRITRNGKRAPASTLWTKLSQIGFMFFEHDQDIKLMKQAAIKKALKAWEKVDPTKQAPCHTRDEVEDFLKRAPNTSKLLLTKIITTVSIMGLLRSVSEYYIYLLCSPRRARVTHFLSDPH